MSKFKVGDAVIPARGDVHDLFGHWMEYWAKDGDVRPTKFYVVGFSDQFVIYNADRNAEDGPHIPERDLQLAPYTSNAAAEVDNLADEYGVPKAKFKVGDRVRYSDYKCSGIGTIHAANGAGDWFVKVDPQDRVYCPFDDCTTRVFDNSNLTLVAVAPATATLTIQAGKFYKTRDGRKVLTGINEGDSTYPFYHETDGAYWHGVTASGKSCLGDADYDIIAEWTDDVPLLGASPVVAPATTAKFRVGDRVKFRDDYNSSARGKEATVVKVDTWGVQVDQGGGAWNVSTEQPSDLILLAAPTTIADIVARHSQSGTAIVAVLENGQPRPATRPFVHTSASAAETEADRLARNNPGKEFGVYTLGAVAKIERVYDHEWQRLAAGGKTYEAKTALTNVAGIEFYQAAKIVNDWREDLMRAA